jgi:E3 ubiquitin-protein ligase MUL1
MIVDLSFKAKVLFWGGIALGTMSVGIIGYAIVRYVGFHDQSI